MNMFSKDKKQHCGLQLMETHARLIEIDGGGKQLRAGRRQTVELPSGSIQNGKIINEAEVVHSVQDMVATLELQGAHVNLTIPTSNIILRRSVFTSLQDQEIRNSIEVELHSGSYKVPFKNTVFDCIRMGSPLQESVVPTGEDHELNEVIRKHKPVQQEDVLVIATPLEVVKAYMQITKQAGLETINVEPSLSALYRGMVRQWKHLGLNMPQRFVMLQTDLGFSEISIFDRGVPVFNLVLNGSHYASVEAYAHNLQTEFTRILSYFKQCIFFDRKDLRQLYLIGETDWIMKLRQPLGMLFEGNMTLLSLAELLNVNEAVYDPYTVLLGQAMRGA
jgi:Tfp pilus assembly PilM family ATPase